MKNTTTLLAILISYSLFAANPLIKDIGMSDPHIRVFNDTIYLFTGNDDSPTDRLWVMKDWRVYSSTDMISWKAESIISPEDNYMDDNSEGCWAADAATRNGKYYFYFSDEKRGVGVMSADAPIGPYTDALGKPLVAPMHDPTLFVDDNKAQTPYLVYGDKHGGGFLIAEVNEDMITLTETPKAITINGEEWENAPKWQDKNYLFKYKDTYYLSWGRDYAISKDVYGPYECVGAVGRGHHLDQLAHGSFFWWKGQFYHIWTYYIKNGFKYRECIISYCHFDAEGRIVTDTKFLDKHFATGIGQYDGAWDEIQAEWYYEKSEDIIKQQSTDGGFEIANIKDGAWLRFANMDMSSEATKFSATLANLKGCGSIQIRLDSPEGLLIGELEVPKSKEVKATLTCKIEEIQGIRDVYLYFKGKNKAFTLDKFSFKE